MKILLTGVTLVDRGLGDHVFVVGVAVAGGFYTRRAYVGGAAALGVGKGISRLDGV